ncbi:MAG: efflux RND transporter periplasmic adaptor subunit [Verrucomicrobiales bacterium]|jgi:RND family efflux transporter MFP subunit|nr:efflux RND transporter periplasmic adaptor subunit [Verrucomicrobiales bacterium]HQZ28378.1 efflux RND transporter periplasmic adaptor subunit [Verrucomicrobiales bacterium]
MKRFTTILIGLLIFLGGIAFSALLWVTRPIAEKKEIAESRPVVEVQSLRYETVAFELPSQGIVEASRRSQLAAEVGGRVEEVNPDFEPGIRIKKGTVLVKIDPSDYEAEKALAAANLVEAETALATEEARAEQAIRDLQKLSGGGSASELARREPQLKSARARADSAKASLAKTEHDLSRTAITAPFDCIVSSTLTEVGSYLTPGMGIGEVFEASPYEIRLPLPVDQLRFLEVDKAGDPVGKVTIHASFGNEIMTYPATIIRSEGEIDRLSRSAYLVSEVTPDSTSTLGLQPGLFVKAKIQGRPIDHIARVPFSAFVDLDRVAVVAPDDTLQFREVTVVFRDTDFVYVSEGLDENERICLTELPAMIKGQKVATREAEIPRRELTEEPAPKPTP